LDRRTQVNFKNGTLILFQCFATHIEVLANGRKKKMSKTRHKVNASKKTHTSSVVVLFCGRDINLIIYDGLLLCFFRRLRTQPLFNVVPKKKETVLDWPIIS
jgi:hypothetical protein